jgi:glycosyltransferase involved in cell wall biosynthesis
VTDALSVIHVVWGAGFGGIERFVSDLARVQAESPRLNVGVLVCGTTYDDSSLARYAAPGVTIHAGGLRSGFDFRRSPLKAVTKTLSAADVIHMHGFTPPVALAVRRAKRPVVFTEHGLLSLGKRWPSLGAVKQSAKGLFLRRQAATVAGVSEWVTEAAGQKYGIPKDQLRLVPDGVGFESIRVERHREEVLLDQGIDPSVWVMVVTARFVQFKRIDRLLEAAALLGGGGREWALLLVGSGPLEDALRQRSASLGIGRNVRFLGYRDHVWDLVAAADLIPVPSDYEAFGLVVVEAMALGRPVVAFTESGGPAEIVHTVGGGCLVDSVEALASVMEQGRGGHPLPGFRPLDEARLRDAYSIQTAAAAYSSLYSFAIKNAQNGGG